MPLPYSVFQTAINIVDQRELW